MQFASQKAGVSPGDQQSFRIRRVQTCGRFERLMKHLDGLVRAGNTVIVIEHGIQVIAQSDWIIDFGPGAGDEGGDVVASRAPNEVAAPSVSKLHLILQQRYLGTKARI
jgi:excinuclease UvrABC ATPase subunit